jgi:hypothetical protein
MLTGNVHGDIHFLKIDVEGAERSVLQGCNFLRFRPWLLAIEATVPCTYTPSHEEWEHLVLGAGYEFALFNQINRYYVAREHVGRKGRIQTPSVGSSVEREILVAGNPFGAFEYRRRAQRCASTCILKL